jgi:hypothetical protein
MWARTLDSPSAMLRVVSSSNHGFRRNDEKNAFSTFCETIKILILTPTN